MALPINDASRQHISLSTYAYNTILSDIVTYDNPAIKSGTVSGLANTIIQNHFDKSFASISKISNNEKVEIDTLIADKEYEAGSIEEKVANELRDSLINKHREELASRMNNYSKDQNVKIRLQNKTVEILENECLDDIAYYKKSLTGYLKALLEDYARQNKYGRECILFSNVIERLETEIIKAEYLKGKSKPLELTFIDFYNEREKIICKPYRITQENEISDCAYLLCMGIDSKNPDDGFVEALLPIANIEEIKYAPRKYGSSFISQDQKKKLEQLVCEHNSYAFGRRKERVLVSLTEDGLNELYHKNVKERPPLNIKSIRKNGNHRYEAFFYCTQKQAYDYFKPFGADGIVLLPKELSEKMTKNFSQTSNLYSMHANRRVEPLNSDEVNEDIKSLQQSTDDDIFRFTWNKLVQKYFNKTTSLNDVESEFAFYKKAAELGYEIAYPGLADLYFENDFFKKNYKKAAYYYSQSFEYLDPYRKANYASLMINNLVEGHTPEEGYSILESLKDRLHKDFASYTTPEGYTFKSYPYTKYDRHNLLGYINEDGRLEFGENSTDEKR